MKHLTESLLQEKLLREQAEVLRSTTSVPPTPHPGRRALVALATLSGCLGLGALALWTPFLLLVFLGTLYVLLAP